jgi:hypothetical protein
MQKEKIEVGDGSIKKGFSTVGRERSARVEFIAQTPTIFLVRNTGHVSWNVDAVAILGAPRRDWWAILDEPKSYPWLSASPN